MTDGRQRALRVGLALTGDDTPVEPVHSVQRRSACSRRPRMEEAAAATILAVLDDAPRGSRVGPLPAADRVVHRGSNGI
eukprot:scaffold13307_cov97-Isochrysis_galbana.AAC.4